MPYIPKEDREKFSDIQNINPQTAGELNYCISMLLKQYLATHDDNYETRNAIIGVMECAKLEFVRKNINGYEDVKIIQNGLI